jgi:hypothetical protein
MSADYLRFALTPLDRALAFADGLWRFRSPPKQQRRAYTCKGAEFGKVKRCALAFLQNNEGLSQQDYAAREGLNSESFKTACFKIRCAAKKERAA